jgi:hypothetical protein
MLTKKIRLKIIKIIFINLAPQPSLGPPLPLAIKDLYSRLIQIN